MLIGVDSTAGLSVFHAHLLSSSEQDTSVAGLGKDQAARHSLDGITALLFCEKMGLLNLYGGGGAHH